MPQWSTVKKHNWNCEGCICYMFCLHTRMSFSDIPLLIHRVSYDISIPFTAITTLRLLGSLSTRFRSVNVNSDHSSRSVFMTLMLEEKAWLSVFTLIHPSIRLRSGLCAGKFFHTKLARLCLYGPCLVHWCTVCCHKAGSIKLSGTNSWETIPHHNPSLLL